MVRIDSPAFGSGKGLDRSNEARKQSESKRREGKKRALLVARIPSAKRMELGVSQTASEEEKGMIRASSKRMGRRSGWPAKKRMQEWSGKIRAYWEEGARGPLH